MNPNLHALSLVSSPFVCSTLFAALFLRLPLYYSWSRVDGGHIPMDRTTFSSLNRVIHIADARLEDSGVYMCTVVGPKNVDTKNISISVAGRSHLYGR